MIPDDAPPPPVLELPEQVRQLERIGTELVRKEQHEDAARIFREIARIAPGHVPALQYLGSRALAQGDLEAAQEYFERTIRIAPRNAMTHQNLGVVLRARGYPEGALQAFDIALKLEPGLPMGWIQRGDVLQALGRHEEAVAAYLRAEKLSGNLIGLSASVQEAPRLRQTIERAAALLARAKLARVDEAIAKLKKSQPEDAFDRVTPAVQHLCNAIVPQLSDPLQRPTLCFSPGLEPRPFFERKEFPFLAALERQRNTIQDELQELLSDRDAFAPYVQEPEEMQSPLSPLNHSSKWRAFHLYRNGERIAEHCARCPATTAIVEALPLVRMESHAPEIFFSILEPGTHIPPHCGIANCKLAVQLPLVLPPRCAIRAGDLTRGWQAGKCLILDDSFAHEAWNRSEKMLAVLTLEIWHPELSEVERESISVAMSALDQFKREAELRQLR